MPVVAYLGPEKTNTHFAAQKQFGRTARYLHAPTVEEVFRRVEAGRADFGVVPIENSLEGSVTHTLDRFIDVWETPVKIWGEIEQPIQHFLITRQSVSARTIRAVYSHPQALAQCSSWLDRNYPGVARRETNSTAEAVEELFRPGASREMAAIGRRELAVEKKLRVVAIPIRRENRTRFLVVSLREPPRGRRNKTSLLLALKDKPGALHDTLMPFKRNRINLTKIESRPSRRKLWEYVFFIDCKGHESDASMKKALAALRRSAVECRVLGSYPLEGRS